MSLSGGASLKVIFAFTDFSGNFGAGEVSSFAWSPCNTWPQLCFFGIPAAICNLTSRCRKTFHTPCWVNRE